MGSCFNIKTIFLCIGIHIIKIMESRPFIFIIGMPIQAKLDRDTPAGDIRSPEATYAVDLWQPCCQHAAGAVAWSTRENATGIRDMLDIEYIIISPVQSR